MPTTLNALAKAEVDALATEIAASGFDARILYVKLLLGAGFEEIDKHAYFTTFKCQHGTLKFERVTLRGHRRIVNASYSPSEAPDQPVSIVRQGRLFTGASLPPEDMAAYEKAERAPLQTQVLRMLADVTDRAPEEITMDQVLFDLGLVDVFLVQLILDIEDKFQLSIDDGSFDLNTTVGDLMRAVKAGVKTKSG